MSEEDVRIVFNNIKDIARLSDRFADVLEESLTDVLDGGEGEDYVGAVFVDAVCLPFQIILLRQSLIVCLFHSFLIWKIYIRSTSQNIRQHYSTFLPFLELRRWLNLGSHDDPGRDVIDQRTTTMPCRRLRGRVAGEQRTSSTRPRSCTRARSRRTRRTRRCGVTEHTPA